MAGEMPDALKDDLAKAADAIERLTPTPEPSPEELSYRWAHKDAVEMGYPSLTEALEHLSELRASRTPSPSLREALIELLDAVDTLHETQSRIVVDPHAVAHARAALSASPAEPQEATEAICEHDWHYLGTDRGGSHKGEDAYKCHKCGKYEYQP